MATTAAAALLATLAQEKMAATLPALDRAAAVEPMAEALLRAHRLLEMTAAQAALEREDQAAGQGEHRELRMAAQDLQAAEAAVVMALLDQTPETAALAAQIPMALEAAAAALALILM